MATPFTEEIVNYLATKSLGTKGTTLFFDFMPDVSSSPIAVVRESPSPASNAMVPVSQVGVQVVTRGNTFAVARQHAAKIYNVIHGMVGVNFTNNRVRAARATGLPTTMGPDSQKRHEVVCLYEFSTHAITTSGALSVGVGGDKDPNLN
jgi:hypothetical protein